MMEPSETWQVDRSIIMRIRSVATQGALDALASSKPRRPAAERDYVLEAATRPVGMCVGAEWAESRAARMRPTSTACSRTRLFRHRGAVPPVRRGGPLAPQAGASGLLPRPGVGVAVEHAMQPGCSGPVPAPAVLPPTPRPDRLISGARAVP